MRGMLIAICEGIESAIMEARAIGHWPIASARIRLTSDYLSTALDRLTLRPLCRLSKELGRPKAACIRVLLSDSSLATSSAKTR